MKLGLDLAGTLGSNRIILSSDNHDVIEIMREGGNYAEVAAAIFDDC
jgi:hypothetical protein